MEVPDEVKIKILLHPGPYVKPRNVIRRLSHGVKTEVIVEEMRALEELGFGTLHSRGAVQKVFLKAQPTKLPPDTTLVNIRAYKEQFAKEDPVLPRSEAAIFRALHQEREGLIP